MRWPHLLRVEAEPAELAPLVEALAAAGERAGWLELEEPPAVPPRLEAAGDAGVLRAVAVADGRSVAHKRLRGEPVLKDLVREHFRGCRVVFVRGEVEAPRLEPRGESWALTEPGGKTRILTADELLARWRKPV